MLVFEQFILRHQLPRELDTMMLFNIWTYSLVANVVILIGSFRALEKREKIAILKKRRKILVNIFGHSFLDCKFQFSFSSRFYKSFELDSSKFSIERNIDSWMCVISVFSWFQILGKKKRRREGDMHFQLKKKIF